MTKKTLRCWPNCSWIIFRLNSVIYPCWQTLSFYPFWAISETVLLENSSIKKSWVPIHFFFQKMGPFYWKTHSIVNWRILEPHPGRLLEKSSRRKHLVENKISRILGRHTDRHHRNLSINIINSLIVNFRRFDLISVIIGHARLTAYDCMS